MLAGFLSSSQLEDAFGGVLEAGRSKDGGVSHSGNHTRSTRRGE